MCFSVWEWIWVPASCSWLCCIIKWQKQGEGREGGGRETLLFKVAVLWSWVRQEMSLMGQWMDGGDHWKTKSFPIANRMILNVPFQMHQKRDWWCGSILELILEQVVVLRFPSQSGKCLGFSPPYQLAKPKGWGRAAAGGHHHRQPGGL